MIGRWFTFCLHDNNYEYLNFILGQIKRPLIDNFVNDDDDIDCNYDDNVIDDDFDYANITNDDINYIDNDDDDDWEGREGPLIVIDDDDDDDYSNVDDGD